MSGARAAALAAGLSLLGCPSSPRRGVPVAEPVTLSAEAQRGELVFMKRCNECHPRGEGGLGPALNSKALPVPWIRTQVRKGLGSMPAFSEAEVSDSDLDALVSYLQQMRRAPEPR